MSCPVCGKGRSQWITRPRPIDHFDCVLTTQAIMTVAVAEAEAAVAALKARRCDGCLHFDQDRVGHEWGTCGHEETDDYFTVRGDFCCRYWEAK